MYFMAVKKSRKQVLVSDLFIFKRRCIYRDTETTVILSEFTCKIVFTKKKKTVPSGNLLMSSINQTDLGFTYSKGKIQGGPSGESFSARRAGKKQTNKQTNNFAMSRGIPRSLVIQVSPGYPYLGIPKTLTSYEIGILISLVIWYGQRKPAGIPSVTLAAAPDRPQVAQARNMSIGEHPHCCVTLKI